MIRLIRSARPIELTNEFVKSLTAEFIATGANVWNHDFLKRALREYSFGKCCYCEVNIDEECKYLEVEHFLPKKHFPDLVLSWDNLLPACKRCNGKKGEHRPDIEPIVDPVRDNPKDFLGIKNYRLRGKNNLGKTTIETLDLNDYRKLVIKRAEIGDRVQAEIEEILISLESNPLDSLGTRARNSLIRRLKRIMEEGQKTSDYCSTVATIMCNSIEYDRIKVLLIGFYLWDQELIDLELGLIEIKFDEVR